MTQLSIPWDVDSNRHRHNRQSVKANIKAAPFKAGMRQRIVEYLLQHPEGATLKELARAFEKEVHKVSPRLSDLKTADVIYDTADEREGCAVVRIKVGK